MIIVAKIKTNSKINKIEKLWINENWIPIYKIYVNEIPENNKANYKILELIKEFFNINLKSIKIIKWLKSKNKTILIENYNEKNYH